MLARRRHGDYEGVVLAAVSKRSEEKIEAFGSAFRATALSEVNGPWFSPPNPFSGIADHYLVREADVINLHWVADYLSTDDVVGLVKLGKPIVWTLHDARPFTGGCHYPGGCERFRSLCSDCPQLRADFRCLAAASHTFDIESLQSVANLSLVSPSRWLGAQARTSKVFSAFRTEVIPNNVDLEVFCPGKNSVLRQELGWNEKAVVVLFGGSFLSEQRKGFTALFEAIRIMLQKPDVRARYDRGLLIFAAFGRGEDVLNSAGFRVHHVGVKRNENEMADLLRAADLYVCPSLEDNLPNTVMEAMACGLPVVGTNVGGIPDMVEDGVNGRLANPVDPYGLSDVLHEMLYESADRTGMGQRSREICEIRFGNGTQARAYAAFFEELLATAPIKLRAPENFEAASKSRHNLKMAMLDCEKQLRLRPSLAGQFWSKAKVFMKSRCVLSAR